MAKAGQMPTEPATPAMESKTLKQLGSPTAQVEELANTAEYTGEQLKAKVEAERERREAAGLTDSVSNMQPARPRPLDQTLVGKRLEIRWKYTEGGGSEPVWIWCSGEVVQVADGVSDKASERHKKLLPAGAVRMKYPEDPEYAEGESFAWQVLHPAKWNRDVQYGWRWDPCELS